MASRIFKAVPLLLLLAACACARGLSQADDAEVTGNKQDGAGQDPLEAQLSHAPNPPPDCQEFIDQHIIKHCAHYTAHENHETLYTIGKKLGFKWNLLLAINTQIADDKLRVPRGNYINIPA